MTDTKKFVPEYITIHDDELGEITLSPEGLEQVEDRIDELEESLDPEEQE